jgi:hypothetical protein
MRGHLAKEPTKEQWYAYAAAGLGWTLDAFRDRSADHAMISTIFFLVIVTIAVLPGPNTRGKNLTAEREIITAARAAQ